MRHSYLLRIPCILSAVLLLIIHTKIAEESVRTTLDLCARVLIPSLFPYMVISALLVRTGASDILGKPLASVTEKLFHLPARAGGALLLGILCGFPLGAQTACELYNRGSITKKEAERLIPLANCAGGAFTIGVIGTHLWNSRSFGIFLYITQILSAWALGAVWARADRAPSQSSNNANDSAHRSVSVGECLGDAITSSAVSMLKICGYVTFFSLFTAILHRIFTLWKLPLLGSISAAFLELTSGCQAASETGGTIGIFLTGLALGWSGVSVLFQCMTFTVPSGISLRMTVFSKGIQGILCGIAAVLWFLLRHDDPTLSCAASVYAIVPVHALYAEIAILILFCLFPLPRSLRTYNTDKNRKSLH